jgi:uncharacterized protein (DUF3820 family)
MTFRTKIFTPGALSQAHRDLIYKTKRHKLLLNDPGITVTMSNDEELRLLPMHMPDRPNKKKSLQRLVELLQDYSDWQNLPAFLEGMQLADEILPKGYMERFVRKANEQGRVGIIIRCAEMVKKTGLTLANPAVTIELMLGIHSHAARADFRGEEMDKALRQAQEIALLMEKDEHCGDKTALKAGHRDMRRDLTVLGTLLELRAAQADQSATGDVIFARVETIAAKIMAFWPREALTVAEDISAARIQLECRLPLWAGLKLALKGPWLSDPELRGKVTKACGELGEIIELGRVKVEEAARGRTRRCLHMYNDVKGL